MTYNVCTYTMTYIYIYMYTYICIDSQCTACVDRSYKYVYHSSYQKKEHTTMKNTSLDQRKKNVMHAWMEWPTKKCSKAQTPINNITGPDNDTTKNTTKIDNKENKASHETSQIRGNEHHLTPFPVLPCQVSAKDLHNLEPKNVFLKALASGLALGEWGYEPWWGLKIHLSLSSIGLASCHKSICMYIYIMPPVWNTGSKKKQG